MAQLYFRYSSMWAGKSIEVLKIAYNYTEQGKRVTLFALAIDDRYGVGKNTSHIGLQQDAILVYKNTKVFDTVKKDNLNCVLVDEGQSLTREQVLELTRVVDELNIPVIVYGPKNDFKNDFFEGSAVLLLFADKIEEVKTVYWYCDRKATMVLRHENNKPVHTGEQIVVGGNESYKPVCRKHYFNPKL